MLHIPKRKGLFYNAEDDLHLLREVVSRNPYVDQERWHKIRENVLQATGKAFTLRSIKERVTLLSEKFAAKVATNEYKSGIEEEVTELDDLLHAILLLINDFKNKPKKESKSQYQRGFDKRELAQNEIEISSNKEHVLDNNGVINEEDYFENQFENIIVSDGDPETLNDKSNDFIANGDPKTTNSNSDITNDVQQEEHIMTNVKKSGGNNKKLGKNAKAGGSLVGTPARVRPGGLKQTSIRYLEKKNDRWYEIRCRELTLAEKKFELESAERKRRLEMDQTRLEMDEKRLKMQMDIFQNQQRLLEMAFETRCQHSCPH